MVDQVFATRSKWRWHLFRWLVSGVCLLLMAALLTLIASLYFTTPGVLPKLQAAVPRFGVVPFHRPGSSRSQLRPWRAAFLVNWDPHSWESLQVHVSELNLVIPEWFFVPATGDQVRTDVPPATLAFLKFRGVPVLAMISNFVSGRWDGEALHRILSSPRHRRAFIASIITALRRYDLAGVNVDFEELHESGDETLVTFQKELYRELHAAHFLVTQDVAPDNGDYAVGVLQKYNDYLIVMGYDEHAGLSAPGPVASASWVRHVATQMARAVPPAKLILGMPAYGYEWQNGQPGQEITYQEALNKAREAGVKPIFDAASANLSFRFLDARGVEHRIYFVDAATNLDELRVAAQMGFSGTALWRLGGEDERLWHFWRGSRPVPAQLPLSKNGGASPVRVRYPPWQSLVWPNPKGHDRVHFIGDGAVLALTSTPHDGQIRVVADPRTGRVRSESYVELPSDYVVHRYGNAAKKIALTFDDGPDATYTPQILDVLRREHVPAAFFVIGLNVQANVELLRRIYAEGHEIGNHSFTHADLSQAGPRRTKFEINATQRMIESLLHRSTLLFRPPYNGDNEPRAPADLRPVEIGARLGMLTVGEAIDPRDWEPGISADAIVKRVSAQAGSGSVLLLHDGGGNRAATVAALPRIIAFFRAQGYTFTSLAGLVHQSSLMPVIRTPTARFLSYPNAVIIKTTCWGRRIGAFFFFGCLVAAGVRLFGLCLLACWDWRRRRAPRGCLPLPEVTAIVPAHNEELTIVRTIEALLVSTYQKLNIIVVDDGSTDQTVAKVRGAIEGHPRARLVCQRNGGKAAAVNRGLSEATSEVIVCIDADTIIAPDAVGHLVGGFADPRVAAVAGNVKIGNEHNVLTRWQALEYITSQNFDRAAFARLNAITVVPGAIGAFRRSALIALGGYASDTLAEDCDLTIRLLKAGHTVTHCPEAIALTEAPEGLEAFLRQRLRWSFGILQTVWKHRGVLFSRSYPILGFIALPHLIVFQIVLPLFLPLADLVFLMALLFGGWAKLCAFYALFLAVDASAATLAFYFEREPLGRLIWLVPQRLAYRLILYPVLVRALLAAVKGEVVGWGHNPRSGKAALGLTMDAGRV